MAIWYTTRYREAPVCSLLGDGKITDRCYQTTDRTLWQCVQEGDGVTIMAQWVQIMAPGSDPGGGGGINLDGGEANTNYGGADSVDGGGA